MTALSAPTDWVESVSQLRFPSQTDLRMQNLMDRNNEGLLTPSEREELESLVEMSESRGLQRSAIRRFRAVFQSTHR